MRMSRDINGRCAPESPTSASVGSSMGLNNLLIYYRSDVFGDQLREGVEKKYLLFVLNDYKWGMREFEKVLLLFFKANTVAKVGTLLW